MLKAAGHIGCHLIATHHYTNDNPHKFDYKGYRCACFEIFENVGGQVIVLTTDKLEYSGVEIKNEIIFSNVTAIEVLSSHET